MDQPIRRKKAINESDKRILRTKKSIRKAFFHLIEQKPLDKITVSEIVKEAAINRSTFYFYYENIEDMERRIQEEVFEQFKAGIVEPDSRFTSPDKFSSYICKFLYFCKENYDICRFVISNDCNNGLFARIKSELERVIPNSMHFYAADDARYYLTTYAISGILYTILEWFKDGMMIPPEEMADYLSSLYLFGSVRVKTTPRMSFGKN